MAALTQPFETYEKPGIVVSYTTASNTTIFKGGLVGVNASGQIVPMSHSTANLKFVGVANETVIATTETKRITITKSGTFVFATTATNVNKTGSEAYVRFDGEVQDAATGLTNSYVVGTIVGIEAPSTGGAGYRIRIDNHTK